MLPETLDDLLSLASGEREAAALLSVGEILRSAPPAILLLAQGDGTVAFADDFGSGLGSHVSGPLAASLAEELADRRSCQVEVQTPAGPRIGLGLRLPQGNLDAVVGCLVDRLAESSEALDDASTAATVCAALAWAAARYMTADAELRARVEQLTAAQEALGASYARGLADVIEEHEHRLRDQKEAERELRQLHACNQMILDSVGEGIVGVDGRGQVTFVNPAVERMLGWKAAEMVGKPLDQVARHAKPGSPPDARSERPPLATLREGSTDGAEHEVFLRKDGTSFPVEYVVTPLREDGKIVGAVLTFQDITKRRILEGQLVQAQKLESIGQLAAGIAHEINTPTQFIGDNLRFLDDAFADLAPLLETNRRLQAATDDALRQKLSHDVAAAARTADLDYLTKEIPSAIAQSLEGVDRVANIVRSMKEFSHPGSDERQSVDLNKALENTLTVCRNEWKYVAEVVTDFDPGLPLAHCLPGECNQAFLNLIINAAHAIAEKQKKGQTGKGTITVGTRTIGEWLEVRVADTGTGIPEPFRTKVFDPFFTTKEVGRGTGQGLAIARSVVVDKHGGTLSFETEVGRGTTFLVRLPRSSASSQAV